MTPGSRPALNSCPRRSRPALNSCPRRSRPALNSGPHLFCPAQNRSSTQSVQHSALLLHQHLGAFVGRQSTSLTKHRGPLQSTSNLCAHHSTSTRRHIGSTSSVSLRAAVPCHSLEMLAIQNCNSSALAVDEVFSNQTRQVMEPVPCRENLTSTTNPTAAGLSMTLGIVSNIVALIILAKAYTRLRKRSKATFLLFASCLVATDLAGHVIPGALVLRLYTTGGLCNHPDATCHFLGGSMVFFGLCPLFLGCGMAVERCMGVTRPLLHARVVCTARAKLVLVMIWLLALTVALLPFFYLGTYTYQYPWTWCFINVLDKTSITDVVFVLLFSGLGLASLAVALVCNTISVMTLVIARLRRKKCQRRSAKSHDIEMVAQLVGIMVTSCICWSPLLIFGLMSVIRSYRCDMGDDLNTYRTLMVMGVRLASWNQILDPWVYILLRRAVLRKIYRLTTGRRDLRGSTFRRWEISSFQNSVKNTINLN